MIDNKLPTNRSVIEIKTVRVIFFNKMARRPIQGVNIGLQDPAYFVGKRAVLAWLNELLDTDCKKIEDTASGAAAAQVVDAAFPGVVSMGRVNWAARQTYQYVANYKVVQDAFRKLGIEITGTEADELIAVADTGELGTRQRSPHAIVRDASRAQLCRTALMPLPMACTDGSGEISFDELKDHLAKGGSAAPLRRAQVQHVIAWKQQGLVGGDGAGGGGDGDAEGGCGPLVHRMREIQENVAARCEAVEQSARDDVRRSSGASHAMAGTPGATPPARR